MTRLARAGLCTIAALALVGAGSAQQSQSRLTRQMGVDQKLGAWVPKEARFKDETGKDIAFGEVFNGRPVLLVPIFYRCKTMCVNITDGLIKTLAKATRQDTMRPGRDFDVVMLSIHPKETPELARAKKVEIFNMLTPPKGEGEDVEWRAGAERGWKLLTGTEDNIRKVTDAIGFRYGYDAKNDLINHPSASMILTPEGQVSSYIIGPTFPTRVLQSDVEIAAKNEVGQKADQSFMFGCIMLDPNTGRYTIVVERVLQLACIVTVLVIAASIASMSLRERRKSNQDGGSLAG